jgi:hypothetical protein
MIKFFERACFNVKMCVCVGAAFESTKKYNSAAQVHLSLSPSPLPHPYLLLLPPSLGRQMHAREKNI